LRPGAVLGIGLALAACAAPPERAPIAHARLLAPGVIEVRTTAPRELTLAELVAPGGQAIAARRIEASVRRAGATAARPDIGVQVEGGSASGVDPSISIGLPVMGLFRRPPPAIVESIALIDVPADAPARPDWPRWQLRLRWGPAGQNAIYRELPAPPPESSDLRR
jgi:hypothetical protein